jgi:hypothetical protein
MLSLLSACDKAPDGIIKESKMADILVDVNKAQAYMEMNPSMFPNDSTKLAMRQSIFLKYGVTQADYDKSLVWYAHNMDDYVKVYDKVIKELKSEQKGIDKQIRKETASSTGDLTAQGPNSGVSISSSNPAHKSYSAKGDTADIWTSSRQWILTSNYNKGYIKFDLSPDKDSKNGDRYELNLKVTSSGNKLKVFLATDYSDGSTSFVVRNLGFDGWDKFVLQTDSTRSVSRVYGYIQYNIRPFSMAFLDSITLLRTHLDRQSYNTFMIQKFISRYKSSVAPRPDAMPPVNPALLNEGGFRPKPGVNKSGVRHTQSSPNAAHLPSANRPR